MKLKNYLLISMLLVVISINLVSAAWWNPFDWFNNGYEYERTSLWFLDYNHGLQLEYFNVDIINLDNGKAKVCLLPKTDLRINDEEIQESRAIVRKSGIQTRIIEPSDMELETEGGKVKKRCVDVDKDLEDYIKFGKHSTVVRYTNESVLLKDGDTTVLETNLITEDYTYKNGKPHKQLGLGYQSTHTFKIKSHDNLSNILNEFELIDMRTGEPTNVDYDLKIRYIENVEIPTYDLNTTTLQNGTVVNNYYQNGSYITSQFAYMDAQFWENELSEGEEIELTVFINVTQDMYIDLVPTIAGVKYDFWASISGDFSTDLTAYYPMDETSGTVYIDVHGTKNGTINGDSINGLGIIESGHDFDGDNFLTTPINLTDYSSYSISFWWRYNTTGNFMMVGQDVAGDRVLAASYVTSSPSGSRLSVYDGTNFNYGPDLNQDTWYHIVITNNGAASGFKIYVNGNLENTTNGFIKASSTHFLWVGAREYSGVNDYLNGGMDELGFWGNRILSLSDVQTIYNSGSGIPYEIADQSPTAELSSPANGTEYNANSISVNFQCKGIDAENLDNLTFYLWNVSDGSLEYSSTNTDGENNTLETFTTTVYGGTNYTWNCKATDNSSQSAYATNNYTIFVYSIPDYAPTVNIGSGSLANNTNMIISPMIVNFNCSNLTDDNKIDNVSLVVNSVIINTTINPANNSYVFYTNTYTDGSYNWYCIVTDNASQQATTETRVFSIDSINPSVTIYEPLTDYGTLVNGQTLDLKFKASDTHLSTCWYYYNNTNTTINCNANTTFTYTTQNWLVFYANDTYGNINITNRSWTYDFVEAGEAFNANVYETDAEDFQFNITTTQTVLQVIARLYYNGTEYDAAVNCVGQACSASTTIDIPLVTSGVSENKSFYWYLQIFDGDSTSTYNSTTQNQTVSKIHLEECNATYVNQTLNFTAHDEQTQARLMPFEYYGTFEYWLGSGTVKQNKTVDNSSLNYYALCIDPANETFYLDADIRYYKNDTNTTYKTGNYYFDNASITNTSQDIYLYLLDEDDATTFIIEVLDQESSAVPGALVYIQRCYEETGLCKTVQVAKTDSNGKTVGFYEVETVDYKHIITLNGVVELDQEKAKVFPESTPYTLIFRIGDAINYPWLVLEDNPSLTVSLGFNSSTNITTFSWIDSSGTVAAGTLYVYQFAFNTTNKLLCTSTAAFSSATVTCNMSNYTGSFVAYANIDGETVDILRFAINENFNTFGDSGLIIGWLIILVVTLLFIWNPIAMIIAHNIAVILVNLIGFITFGPIYIFSMIAVSILAIIVLRT